MLASGGADALAREAGVAAKALAPFGGRALVAWVLEALRASRVVERIVVVLPEGVEGLDLPPASGVVPIVGGRRLVDSLALGLGAAGGLAAERLMVVTADLPWLTGAIVDDFITRAADADLVYAAVPADAMRRRFPAQRRTYARLRDGTFTGGNAVLLSPAVVPALLPLVERAYRSRKNPLALASLIGWDVTVQLLAHRLSIRTAERRIGSLLGAEARAMRDADPALAADIDRPEHLALRPPHRRNAAGDTA